jgi:hypothetical protein
MYTKQWRRTLPHLEAVFHDTAKQSPAVRAAALSALSFLAPVRSPLGREDEEIAKDEAKGDGKEEEEEDEENDEKEDGEEGDEDAREHVERVVGLLSLFLPSSGKIVSPFWTD